MALSSFSLSSLAALMALEPADAIALPTVMEVAASKASMTQDRLYFEALTNEPLRAYLAECCRKAMVEVVA